MKKVHLILILILSFGILKAQENFDKFISKFAQDSTFQYSRILFPLNCITWDFENDKEFVFSLKINQWNFDRLYYDNFSDAYSVFYNKSKPTIFC
jgi:hypothetical protein